MAAFLSGEMKDTVEINPMASYLLEKMFSRKERADLFRGWAGSASMWLKVGCDVLGLHCRCLTADQHPSSVIFLSGR
jgi:phospholipid:diacylglycerol acyltransferase